VLSDYDATVEDLQPQGMFETLAPSYAGLMTMLGSRSRGTAKQTLEWLQEHHKNNPDGSTVADMLMDLNASLLIRPDLDAARSNLLHREELKRKQRLGTGKIETGKDEVNMGGIKVKIRKSDFTA